MLFRSDELRTKRTSLVDLKTREEKKRTREEEGKEAGTEVTEKFRSGFYYLAKELDIPYVPVEIDFKNRAFNLRNPEKVTSNFEDESQKVIKIFEGVEGATRTFTMSKQKEQKD